MPEQDLTRVLLAAAGRAALAGVAVDAEAAVYTTEGLVEAIVRSDSV
jgi:hypothetical protein